MSAIKTLFLRLLDDGEALTRAVRCDYDSPHPEVELVHKEAVAEYGAGWAEPGEVDTLLSGWNSNVPTVFAIYRQAVQEARQAGELSTLDPVLSEAIDARGKLIEAAMAACETQRPTV